MTESNGAVKEALRHVARHFEDHKRTLSRSPSVSANGFPPEEVRRSAEATADALRRAGVEHVQVLGESLHLEDWAKSMRSAVHLYDELSRVRSSR